MNFYSTPSTTVVAYSYSCDAVFPNTKYRYLKKKRLADRMQTTNIQFCRHWGSRNSRRIFELLLCGWMWRGKRDCGSDTWYGCWGCRHCQHRWLGDNWSNPGKHGVDTRLGQAWVSAGNILTSDNLLKRNRSRISYWKWSDKSKMDPHFPPKKNEFVTTKTWQININFRLACAYFTLPFQNNTG